MGELGRKLLHLSGGAIPFLAASFGPVAVVAGAALLSAIYVAHELLDLHLFRHVKRGDGFDAAPLNYGLSVSVLLVLPTEPSAAYAAIMVLALGDGFAGIVGRRGDRELVNGKTVEGSAACFVAGLAGSLLFLDPLSAVACSAAGTAAEALLPHDNLGVPFAAYLGAVAAGVP